MRLPRTYRTAGIGPLHLGKAAHFGVEHVHLLHQAAQGSFGGLADLLVNALGLCGVREKKGKLGSVTGGAPVTCLRAANLIVVQRRVVAQSADGGQLNQSIVLATLDGHVVLRAGGQI